MVKVAGTEYLAGISTAQLDVENTLSCGHENLGDVDLHGILRQNSSGRDIHTVNQKAGRAIHSWQQEAVSTDMVLKQIPPYSPLLTTDLLQDASFHLAQESGTISPYYEITQLLRTLASKRCKRHRIQPGILRARPS